MTVFIPTKRMLFWQIDVAGFNITSTIQQYISSISINYKLNGVTTANIDVISRSFIEDILVEKQKIKIQMGYDRFTLWDMFEGVIKAPPAGQGSDKIAYKITAVGKETTMATTAKNRIFQIQTKPAIIAQIAAENGYIPVLNISDLVPIPAKYAVIQKNKTDLDMLNYCANKWNCLMWFDEPNFLYFCDADVAHSVGDVLKTKRIHMEDLYPTYDLGYRTDYSKNNIANISWSFGSQKGGGVGSTSNTGANESGSTIVKIPVYLLLIPGLF
jgi:phage protein D